MRTAKVAAVTYRILLATLLMAAVALTSSCSKQPSMTNTAEGIVDSMAKGDFTSATKDFNAVMKSQLSSDQLGQVWAQMAAQVGPFRARTSSREAEEQGYNVVYVTCQFERSNADIKVVFDGNKQVTGLFVVPSQSTPVR